MYRLSLGLKNRFKKFSYITKEKKKEKKALKEPGEFRIFTNYNPSHK